MNRSELIATVQACAYLSPEWMAAVRALGAARRAGFKPEKRRTGKDFYQTLFDITRSHHFSDAERDAYRKRARFEFGSEVLYQEVTRVVRERAAVERQQRQEQKLAQRVNSI